MAGKFEIYKDNRGQHRFRLKASNGECILASQGYKSKSGSKNGIASVQRNCSANERFDRRKSKNGKFFFVLKAGNNQIIGTSEMYESERAMENGISSVQKNGSNANIADLSEK